MRPSRPVFFYILKSISRFPTRSPQLCLTQRQFSVTSAINSGHSKWSTIKHDKAKKDNARQKQIQQFINEIATSSRLGGADPNSNPRLALAISRARKGSCHKATVDAAIARGQGLSSSGAKLETFVDGATLSQSPSTAILIDCLTDNQTQTRIDIRTIFKKLGATPSSTTYMFDKIGRISFTAKEDVVFDAFVERAIDLGVDNFEQDEDGNYCIEMAVSDMTSTGNKLKDQFGLEIQESGIIWKPQMTQPVLGPDAQDQLRELVEQLTEIPSVRGVYVNESKSEIAGYISVSLI